MVATSAVLVLISTFSQTEEPGSDEFVVEVRRGWTASCFFCYECLVLNLCSTIRRISTPQRLLTQLNTLLVRVDFRRGALIYRQFSVSSCVSRRAIS